MFNNLGNDPKKIALASCDPTARYYNSIAELDKAEKAYVEAESNLIKARRAKADSWREYAKFMGYSQP